MYFPNVFKYLPLISRLPSLAAVTKLGASADISHRYLPRVLRLTLVRNTDFFVDFCICYNTKGFKKQMVNF